MTGRTAALGAVALVGVCAVGAARGSAATTSPIQFTVPVALSGAAGGTEPRVAVAPDGSVYAVSAADTISSAPSVPLTVYSSHDHGASWAPTRGAPATISPTADVDIVTTRTGRVVVAELDSGGLNVVVSYSDDGGVTWNLSSGAARLVDQDRPWLAVGPDDPGTHQPRVYLLYHDLFGGNATQNMWVETSSDAGATFGAPVPLTSPGGDAFLDLQCGASTGPSNLAVDQRTGRLYAFWGTRHGPLGGCGNTPPQPTTIVAQNRLWVATSPDNSVGSWTDSLAVDDAGTGRLVGMQLAPGAVDGAGNVDVVYPEAPQGFPDFSGAAIRVRQAPADLSTWSPPITIAAASQPGNVLAHIVAGDAGKFDVAYFAGRIPGPGLAPRWYMTVAQVLNGLAPVPTVTTQQVSAVPAYAGTASDLMGWCDANAQQTGAPCNRSSDVWGVALDSACRLIVSWPSLSATTDPTLGASVDATWVSAQSGGTPVCGAASAGSVGSSVPGSGSAANGLSNTSPGGDGMSAAATVAAGLLVMSGVGARSGRRGRSATRVRPAAPQRGIAMAPLS